MSELKHTYYERRSGTKTLKPNQEIQGIANGWVGQEFGQFKLEIADLCPDGEPWYGLAYLLEAKREDLLAAVADADDDAMREAVIAIEERHATERDERKTRKELEELADDASPEELKAMREAAEEAKEAAEDEPPTPHEELVEE